MKTIGQWIAHCEQLLDNAGLYFGHGTDNAHDEAAWLVTWVAAPRSDPDEINPDMPVGSEQANQLRTLIKQRIEHKLPMAYVLGEAAFAGLRFEVNSDVLVPRSPIAELIGSGFEPWFDVRCAERVLDLCTGCGCIGIALAVHHPKLQVDLADISGAALDVARRNVNRHGVAGRVRLVQSDLFAALGDQRYNLIVSNPPYVPEREIPALPAEYRAEPAIGLSSGNDGLDLPLRIISRAANHLEPGGILICELGDSAGCLQDLLPKTPFIWLEFEHGGEGVFTIDREGLLASQASINRAMENRLDVV